MTNTTVIDKVNSLNKRSGYSNNRMAYELSKILKERIVDKTTPQQEASARKEFSQVFLSKINPSKNKEELANQYRDRFLKQMGITPPKDKLQANRTSNKVESHTGKNKTELSQASEVRQAIPQIIKAIIFKGKAFDTSHKSLDTPRYNASLEIDGDNKNLALSRKNDKSLALEAIKNGQEEFEIINHSISPYELEQIQNFIKVQLDNNNTPIKAKNQNSGLEM